MPVTRPHSYRDLGFSLIEVLITLSLLGLVASASILLVKPPSPSLQLGAAARELCADIRLAHAQALAANSETLVRINAAERTYEGPNGLKSLPAGSEITVTFASTERSTSREGAFRFYPTGRSTGGEIKLTLGTATAVVAVNWLTGQARCDV